MSPHNDLDLEESESNSLHGIPAQDGAPPQQICCKRLSGSEDAVRTKPGHSHMDTMIPV